MDRTSHISKLRKGTFDLLIIGGGATGVGTALDAASRGLKVGLVERGDFACGTSSRSTKLIHGGVRYLEKAILEFDRSQFNLVRDALVERATLVRIAPHLAHPLPIFTPVYRRRDIPYYLTGLKLYDRLAGRANLKPSHFVGPGRALQRFPMLRAAGLKGGVIYYDGQFDDARMNVAIALTAAEAGAVLANYVEATGFEKNAEGRIDQVQVRDVLSGESWSIRARVVVNAAGPFVDRIRRLDDPASPPLLQTSSGSHIVLPARFTSENIGFLVPKTEDGRVLFVLPWLNYALVGTTDTPAPLSDHPKASEEDVDYILRQMGKYFSEVPGKKDILAKWSGLRPLVSDPRAADTAGLVRDHVIQVSPSHLLTIAGGKWTTYRKMALDTTDHAVQVGKLSPKGPSRTESMKLAGADKFGRELFLRLEKRYGLDREAAAYLGRAYGDRAERVARLAKEGYGARLHPAHPHLEAEVLHVAREESAQRVVDVLARRMRLAFLDEKAARDVAERVSELLAEVHGWSAARRKEELSLLDAYLA